MKTKIQKWPFHSPLSGCKLKILIFTLLGLGVCHPGRMAAVGTWTAMVNQPPGSVNNMLLLPDGTVIAHDCHATTNWYQLTPDAHGSYAKGTWTPTASMHHNRLYFASQVLTNGEVFVAGAEYSDDGGATNGEIYDPNFDTWTVLPKTPGLNGFSDSISEILPSGNVLVQPVTPASCGQGLICTAAGKWSAGPTLANGCNQDEASWVKLPDDSILTIDPFGQDSERFIPSLNQWIIDSTVPVALYNPVNNELGPALLLPNGNAFFLGGTNHTAIYTPSGTTSPGTWTVGPNIPNNHGVEDGPAAMMVNGKALCCVGTNANFNPPSWFYEYDSTANSFAPAPSPTNSTAGAIFNVPPFECTMLDLPDGTVLLSTQTKQLYVYKPDGSPLATGQPTIIDCPSYNNLSVGPFQLTGTLLNGISEGASYGDDEQMNSNYPIIRMTNVLTGNVYYNQTFNWNSTSVMTGAKITTTEFSLGVNVVDGEYSLVVVANGIASAPVSFRVRGIEQPGINQP